MRLRARCFAPAHDRAHLSLFLPVTAGTTETWLRGEGRKGRAENANQMGVAWHWGRGPGPDVEGAPPWRPRAFLVFAVALAEFKGRSGVEVTAQHVGPMNVPCDYLSSFSGSLINCSALSVPLSCLSVQHLVF